MVYVYLRNFVSIGSFCRPVAAKNPTFAVFWTSAFSAVANWQQSEKAENGVQLQTFPYPMVSKSFLYSNAFMAKSGAQSDVQKRDEQTDKQTKNSTFLATPAAGEIRAPPNFGMVIEDLEHVLSPLERLVV